MNARILLAALIVGAATLSQPAAARSQKVEGCVELGEGFSLQRTGSQYLYLIDGADHYKVSFQGGRCDAMAMTSKLELSTGNRVCASETYLKAKNRDCRVQKVEQIDAEDFEAALRRGR